jgi:hypothetical protein
VMRKQNRKILLLVDNAARHCAAKWWATCRCNSFHQI